MLLELQSSTHSLHGGADGGGTRCGYAKLAAASLGVDVQLEKVFFLMKVKEEKWKRGWGSNERAGDANKSRRRRRKWRKFI